MLKMIIYYLFYNLRLTETFCTNSGIREFPAIHKYGNVGIFVFIKFENMLDREINPLNFNSKHYDKCKFSLKHIGFLTVSNLFLLEVVQKMSKVPALCIT